MSPEPHIPWWQILGAAIGAVLASVLGITIKGMRDLLRDIETSRLRIIDLEARLERMENAHQWKERGPG